MCVCVCERERERVREREWERERERERECVCVCLLYFYFLFLHLFGRPHYRMMNYSVKKVSDMLDSTNSDPDFINTLVTGEESWMYGYDPETKSFRHCPYNENLTSALNNTSLKCCLPSTDAIDRREKIHAFVWRFNVALWKRASMKSTKLSQKM